MKEAERKQYKRQNDYNAAHYERINLVIQKGFREQIRKAAEKNGESVNAYVKRIILEDIERSGF